MVIITLYVKLVNIIKIRQGEYYKDSTGCITSLTLKTTFQAVDYNEYSKDITEIKESVSDKVSLTKDEEIAGIKTFKDEITAPNQVDYTNITNCITKIPQDIKLSYENGIIKLGRGKVYDGAGNAINITNEISRTLTADTQLMLYTNKTGTAILYTAATFQAFSGDTPPSTSQTAYSWYDTSEKRVKLYTSSTYDQDMSLPIGLLEKDGTITAFNGFGYIGNTVFALPNVEGLAPNGRNEDGSLKNTKITSNKVWVRDFTNQTNTNGYMCLAPTGIGFNPNLKYNDDKNYLIDITNNNINNDRFEISYVSIDTTGRIIGFKPKYNLQIVDRSDTQWISSQGKPSNKGIDLTLGASGTQYTAPANGWVCLRKQATAIGQYAELVTGKIGSICYSGQETTVAEIYIPVSKGEQFTSFYSVAGETELFRFTYDEGFK